ncbi:hypothetical protein [Actinomadura sp. 3N508]|uniref:hypothetical protein n=1 Tax=Actinomadura sp. 3N508 TaxID=3375153 RepID=UPI00379E2633
MKRAHRVRQVVNAVNLSTGLGLLLAATGTPGSRRLRRLPDGLLLAGGYRLPFPIAPAFTVGNVVLVRGDASRLESVSREAGRSRLLRHEGRHATQYAWCLGPVMIPLYGACAGVSMLLCGDWASYNPFERLAGLDDGGYERHPLRPYLRTRRRGEN